MFIHTYMCIYIYIHMYMQIHLHECMLHRPIASYKPCSLAFVHVKVTPDI